MKPDINVIVSLFVIGLSGLISLITGLISLESIETFMGLMAVIPLVLIVRFSMLDGSINQRLLSIGYILGSLLCWVFGFLACLYLKFDIAKYPAITMILINIVTWGALAGSYLARPFYKAKYRNHINIRSVGLPKDLLVKCFRVSLVIFILFTVTSYLSGGFNARFDIGSDIPTNSPLYFWVAISVLQPLVFLFSGLCLSSPLLNIVNLPYIIVVLLGILVSSTTGGREGSIKIVIFFFLGCLYSSKVTLRQIRLLVLLIIPLVLGLILSVGYARVNPNFNSSDIGTRTNLLITEVFNESSKIEDPLELLFTRIAEPSGQTVIDNVYKTGDIIGLENLDRISMVFIPKILSPYGNKNYDDSSERLEKYGIVATQFTAAPITLMADSFERGGYLGVLFISLVVSFVLTIIGGLFTKIDSQIIRIVLLSTFAISSIRIYSMSVLGFISFITYVLSRDILLIWLIFGTSLAKVRKENNAS